MDMDIMTANFYLLIRAIDFVEVLPNGFVRIFIFKVVFSYMQYHSLWSAFAHLGWLVYGGNVQSRRWETEGEFYFSNSCLL